MPFQLIRADITAMDCDAIVNAANGQLQAGGGVCGAIFMAAGYGQLQAACDEIGSCETGQSVITPGFNLKARYVIHTVGPVWRGGGQGEEALLRSCYRSALNLAAKRELNSVAFPLISAGIYGYPRQQAIEVAASEIGAFLNDERNPDIEVTLVLFDRCSYREGRGLFGDIVSYLDERSADVAQIMRQQENRMMDASPAPMPSPAQLDDGRMAEWVASRLRREETFAQCLLRLIDESGEKDAAVYKRANVDRRLFSKIRSNAHYQPGKSTVLAFCLALRLSVEDSQMLLGKAGYALTYTSRFDLAVEYCLKHRVYDVHQVNLALFELDLPLLGA